MFKNRKSKREPIFKKIKYQTVETDLTTKTLTLVDHQKSRNYYKDLHEIKIKKPFRKP
jgi:hypothetical protein